MSSKREINLKTCNLVLTSAQLEFLRGPSGPTGPTASAGSIIPYTANNVVLSVGFPPTTAAPVLPQVLQTPITTVQTLGFSLSEPVQATSVAAFSVSGANFMAYTTPRPTELSGYDVTYTTVTPPSTGPTGTINSGVFTNFPTSGNTFTLIPDSVATVPTPSSTTTDVAIASASFRYLADKGQRIIFGVWLSVPPPEEGAVEVLISNVSAGLLNN